jgi:F-type H+-transporting ATPase subunit a
MIVMSIFNPVVLIFVGALEFVSQLVNVISLSFRLFGNIYAGEAVLHTISNIFAVFAPLPFLMLEVVVGFVQALVFSMLTLVFMVILTTPHHEANEEVSHA